MQNEQKKTTVMNQGMIWFGAAVSIAEIMTGTLLAPLGFAKGAAAIVLGHLIGCALLWAAGLLGAKTGRSAMETVKTSFGGHGAKVFAALNVLQLVGWTAVMTIGGARAVGVIANPVTGIQGEWLWCLVIGALIVLWILVGIQNLGKLNVFAMGALFLLTVVLSVVVFQSGTPAAGDGTMSFGAAVELSVAMPLSWLPLISDYTRNAQKPEKATAVSASVYFVASCWMYLIGLGAALFTGESDIALILVQAGLGLVGVVIIIISTVTTTFLDAYSAGVSAFSLSRRLPEKGTAVVVCLVGTALAIFTPIEQFENFLYLIGSVFAPMIAILIADFFLLKKDHSKESFSLVNFILWAVGFVIYRVFMTVDTVVGSTLPVMIIIALLCILVNWVRNLIGGKNHDELQ